MPIKIIKLFERQQAPPLGQSDPDNSTRPEEKRGDKVFGPFDDHRSANRAMLEFLQEQGMSQGEIWRVYNDFTFKTEKDCYRAADDLAEVGFEERIIVEYDYEKPPYWTLSCTIRLAMNPEKLDKLYSFMKDVAERYDGLYDGWEVWIEDDEDENDDQ